MKISGVISTVMSINFSWIFSIIVYEKIIPSNTTTPLEIIKMPFSLEPYRFDKTNETPMTIIAGAILSDMNWNSFGAASNANIASSEGIDIKLKTVITSATKNIERALDHSPLQF